MTLVSCDVKLDLQNDAIELFGIRYALTCFRELGLGEPGDTFRIVSRESDGVIVLQRISREPTADGALKDLRQRLGMETCAAPSTDLRDYGYAPGNYSGKCFTCEQMMDFVDKRCHCCKPCAQKKMDAAFAVCTPANR